MSLFDINLYDYLPCVVEAFTWVYGKEYESLIYDKLINKLLIVHYSNLDVLEKYVSSMRYCKFLDCFVNFLEGIGLDTSKYKKDNYTGFVNPDLINCIDHYIYGNWDIFLDNFDYIDHNSPIRSFEGGNFSNSCKATFINYVLGRQVVHGYDIDDFLKNGECEEVMSIISKYNDVFDDVFMEYLEWEESLNVYTDYINDEKKRFDEISFKYLIELYNEIKDGLPQFVRELISGMNDRDIAQILFDSDSIISSECFEMFSSDNMSLLRNMTNKNLHEKGLIVFKQCIYFENLGIDCPVSYSSILRDENVDELLRYIDFLDSSLVIPTSEFVDRVMRLREKKIEEMWWEYYTTRKDFMNSLSNFAENDDVLDFLYNHIRKDLICITGGLSDKCGNIPIMFYQIRDFGFLFYNFVHECGHAIDQKGCGFEILSHDVEKNLYNKEKRKYERFNEAINDIFVEEAVNYFQDNGVYLLESYEFTNLESSNYNTYSLIRDILKLLVKKYRNVIIKAKVNSNPDEFIRYIGVDNYEILIDSINKIDYLCERGLLKKLKFGVSDKIVMEYYEELGKINKVYREIGVDEYLHTEGYDEDCKYLVKLCV